MILIIHAGTDLIEPSVTMDYSCPTYLWWCNDSSPHCLKTSCVIQVHTDNTPDTTPIYISIDQSTSRTALIMPKRRSLV